jgi:DnaJ-domain-containing protein 1
VSAPPDRLKAILAVLAGVQRSGASGSLVVRGTRSGVIGFEGGRAVRALDVASAAEGVPATEAAALRARARRLLEDALRSGETPVLEPPAASSDPAGPPPASGGGPDLTAGDLILDLVDAAADPDWIRSAIEAAEARAAHNPDPPPVLPRAALSPAAGFLLSRADGTLTMAEILSVSPMSEGDALKALYGLLAAGLLHLPGYEPFPGAAAPRTARPPERPAEPPAVAPAEPPATKAAPAPGAPGAATARKVSDLDAFLKRTSPATATAGTAPETAAPAASPSSTPDAHGRAPAASPSSTPDVYARAPAAPPTSPPGVYARAPAIEAERERVEARIAECQGADHYRVLGVDRTADENAVRRAYYKLAKRFHPDKFRKADFEDMLADIESMFAATTEAYNTLTDEKARREYDRQLAERAGVERPPDVDRPAAARESYLRARKHLEAEELFDALRLLETACQMDPDKPEYLFYLGQVQTRNPRWRKKAEQSFLKVIEMAPGYTQAYLHLARLYKGGGLARRASEMFEKVLEWEPANEEALAELGRGKSEGAAVTGRLRSIFKGSKT